MAKSKKSRRARRQKSEKSRQQSEVKAPATTVEVDEVAVEPEVEIAASQPALQRKVVNFANEYHYVYTDLRNMLVIAVVLFVVMFGLLYII
jgi:hypothetical protein